MRFHVFPALPVLLLSLFLLAPAVHADELLPHPRVGDDGLHKQDWFKESFLDLAEDLQEARDEGKRLALFIEQKGCGYCRKMHEINLREPKIVDYINKHFHVIQLDLKGAREVTDFDGEALTERKYTQKIKMVGTPKIVFFHDDPAKVEGKSGLDALAWQYEGYIPREHYLRTFEYIVTKGYEDQAKPDFFVWLQGPTPKMDVSFEKRSNVN